MRRENRFAENLGERQPKFFGLLLFVHVRANELSHMRKCEAAVPQALNGCPISPRGELGKYLVRRAAQKFFSCPPKIVVQAMLKISYAFIRY